MNLTSIPALTDNYIWTLTDDAGSCLIVDPGEARPLIEKIEANRWTPVAVLLTHHHQDHTGGVAELLQRYPQLEVYGPQETAAKGAQHIVHEGETVTLLGLPFQVIATPGHTLGHISYYSAPYLFCGDTMFSGGCGRLFEGSAEQMFHSFQKLNQLPADTLICCAHEYTLSNMKFAAAILPHDPKILARYQEIKDLRAENRTTLPTKLALEREINLFLRTQDADLQKALAINVESAPLWQTFAELRNKKDQF
ncbi:MULTISPECIES: hydroxyacylglutathione hydrolase [Pantoea]|jgi:hydroxyacylglutathione hydrolase|uniref:hydroxyacylglutathione hydrolase n=1 Tax=Pantoea TaxID=53335 RepID=UPI0008FD665F|nr:MULTISPECIES: hydroxyacylglutathione hydrolase [Pantoea]MCL9646650.1 hydroxyacylglutathione hydrolase [Pantoea eucrina]MDJ0024602.1 hydroxyacylglutathione hydrolase [Pantoea eucrina]NIE69267.1 hydroxyacylglutathione hydrolase [Pantoea sp. Acro-807]OIX97513.1 hydroxyacylglutathione hydrolase [Pantoea sp. Ae16]